MAREGALSGPPQLLERNRELASVDACLAAATAEQGSFLVLEGRAGMGKSALLAELRRRAEAAGLTICSGIGSELERDFAFGVVRQLFEPAIGTLSKEDRSNVLEGAARLAEPLLDMGEGRAAPDQFAALHGLYWLAANLSVRTPLLVAVDDAHWADVASLRWLAYLLNRLEGLPILVAIATRPAPSGPEGEVLTTILAHPHVRILAVRPLGDGSVATLVRSTLGADPDPIFTLACLRATAGSPLGLNELLRELSSSGIEPTSVSASDLDKRAPDAIARRVQRDLNLLGEAARRLASAIAVIGDGTELRWAARLGDVEPGRAAEVADDLSAADILASERPPRFAHPLLRAAVYDHLPQATRQEMHRRAAEILRSAGADPETVAAHLLRCDAESNPETIECLRAAAPLALRRGAAEVAVSYLRRALAEDAGTAQRGSVLAELGRAEFAAGNSPTAIGDLREALNATTDQAARAAILGDLAVSVLAQGDQRGARDLLEQTVEEFRSCDEEAAEGFEINLIAQTLPTLESHYRRLRELARGGRPNAELARVTLAYLLSFREGRRDEVLPLVGSDFGKNLLFGRDDRYIWSPYAPILALIGIDELDRAADLCDTVVEEGLARGLPQLIAVAALQFKSRPEMHMGLLAEAEADVVAALEFSQQHFPFVVPMAEISLAQILFERGRQAEAFELIEGTSLIVDPGIQGHTLEIRGRLRCARGWQQRGVEDLRAAGTVCEAYRLSNPLTYSWRASLAAALLQECPDEARRLAEDDLANARRCGIPRAIGIALRTLARHDGADSVDLLRASVTALEGSPGPLDLARSLVDLGSALRRKGHRVEAREPLRAALEIAARCGAVPLMERAEAEALAAGARPRRPRLRGVDALTPSELRVARLAAEGRSNREVAQALFITTRTVATHLGSSYSKLGISSRDQLATALDLSTT